MISCRDKGTMKGLERDDASLVVSCRSHYK